MLSTRERLPGPEIFAAGAASDAARKEYGDWFAAIMRHEWFANGVMLGYRYDNSPIVWPDGTPAPPDLSHPYTQTARPGARAPHVLLGDGRSTLDLFGRGFVLLRLGADAARGREDRRAAARARRAVDRASPSPTKRCWRPTSAAWCWCGRTAMSPGAPTPSPPTPAP